MVAQVEGQTLEQFCIHLWFAQVGVQSHPCPCPPSREILARQSVGCFARLPWRRPPKASVYMCPRELCLRYQRYDGPKTMGIFRNGLVARMQGSRFQGIRGIQGLVRFARGDVRVQIGRSAFMLLLSCSNRGAGNGGPIRNRADGGIRRKVLQRTRSPILTNRGWSTIGIQHLGSRRQTSAPPRTTLRSQERRAEPFQWTECSYLRGGGNGDVRRLRAAWTMRRFGFLGQGFRRGVKFLRNRSHFGN